MSRDKTLQSIAFFLRDRNIETRKVMESLKGLSMAQRDVIVKQDSFLESTQTEYTVNDLAKAFSGNLDYNRIRYALIGSEPKAIKAMKTPKALARRGIVINYEEGRSKPKFYYSSDAILQILNGDGEHAVETADMLYAKFDKEQHPDEEVKPEPSPEPSEASEPVKEECTKVHLKRFMMHAIQNMVNEPELKIGEDGIIYGKDDSPLYGVFMATTGWCEANGYPVDLTKEPIKFDTTHVDRSEIDQP